MQAYAVIFPGQGSQSVGMLSEIASFFPSIEATFAEASAVLQYDLWDLVRLGPAEKLDQTTYTQPALLAASCALWRVLQDSYFKTQPVALLGHSLGEYSALVSAGALSFADAIRLVAARGAYMQEAVPLGQGTLAVLVGLDESVVQRICDEAAEGQVLSPANFNSPGQIVVAGEGDAVERAMAAAKQAGAKLAKLLPVSVPSHCALMKPAALQLEKMLKTIEFKMPEIPVINNVDARAYDSPQAIREGLVRQLYSPVRWVDSIRHCHHMGAVRFFECGPNKILMGLGKRIQPDAEWLSVIDQIKLIACGDKI